MVTSARYSSKAAPGLAYLKAGSNDLHVFIEDTSSRKLWGTLIRKHLPSGVKFTSPSMLGGKEAVIKAFESDTKTNDINRIYIIDSDFDALNTRNPRRRKTNAGAILHSTLGYCIENHLLQEEAIIDVCGSMSPEASDDEVRDRLDFRGLMQNCNELLTDLFAAYAVLRQVDSSEKTVSISCKSFFLQSGRNIRYCQRKIRKHLYEMKKSRGKLYDKSLKEKFKETRYQARILGADRVVSGKDYIFPALVINAQKNSGFKGEVEQLKLQIVRSTKYSCDRALKRHIREALKLT